MLVGCQSIAVSPVGKISGDSSTAIRRAALGLRLTPAKIGYSGLAPLKTVVRILGGTPPYSVSQDHPGVADLSDVVKVGRWWRFSLTLVAGGLTNVTVTDSAKRSVLLAAGGMPCSIPVTEFIQLYPRPDAKHVAANVGEVVMAEQSERSVSEVLERTTICGSSRRMGSRRYYASGSFKLTHKTAPKGSAPGIAGLASPASVRSNRG